MKFKLKGRELAEEIKEVELSFMNNDVDILFNGKLVAWFSNKTGKLVYKKDSIEVQEWGEYHDCT